MGVSLNRRAWETKKKSVLYIFYFFYLRFQKINLNKIKTIMYFNTIQTLTTYSFPFIMIYLIKCDLDFPFYTVFPLDIWLLLSSVKNRNIYWHHWNIVSLIPITSFNNLALNTSLGILFKILNMWLWPGG